MDIFRKQIIDDNLPSNKNFGICEKDDVFKEYNKQSYTATLQPGVYTRNQIVETYKFQILEYLLHSNFEPVSREK